MQKLGQTWADIAMEERALFQHPLATSPLSNADGWTASEDRTLALAVRRHLFDFAAAAGEFGRRDAEACRRRWAELDLAACVGFLERAPVAAEEGLAHEPSDFNIFHNSLTDQVRICPWKREALSCLAFATRP